MNHKSLEPELTDGEILSKLLILAIGTLAVAVFIIILLLVIDLGWGRVA